MTERKCMPAEPVARDELRGWVGHFADKTKTTERLLHSGPHEGELRGTEVKERDQSQRVLKVWKAARLWL